MVAGNPQPRYVRRGNAEGARAGIQQDAEVGLVRQQDSEISQVVAGRTSHDRTA